MEILFASARCTRVKGVIQLTNGMLEEGSIDFFCSGRAKAGDVTPCRAEMWLAVWRMR
jgi:hypothetical protein